jgi:hypothetical protein
MTALPALIDLLVRVGAELDFDVARNVEGTHGLVDVVWFDRSLPLAATDVDHVDLRQTPVLPVVAFIARTAAMFDVDDLTVHIRGLEGTHAPLRLLVIGRDSVHCALAPVLQSVDQLRKQEGDALSYARIGAALRDDVRTAGRTMVMLQAQFVEWARRLRDVRPRSYSAESLFNRTGAIE